LPGIHQKRRIQNEKTNPGNYAADDQQWDCSYEIDDPQANAHERQGRRIRHFAKKLEIFTKSSVSSSEIAVAYAARVKGGFYR
jgi:hypothetical protein